MRRVFYKYAIGCAVILLPGVKSFGQSADADTTARQAKIDNIVAGYYSSIGEQSRLYSGTEYNFYNKLIKGSAYYTESSEFTTGTVEYDGFEYKNLQLMFDLVKGSVVMQLPSKIVSIELVTNRVQSFDIFGHHFVMIDALTQPNGVKLASGFYDLLYKGKTEFIAHREKTIQASSSVTLDSFFTDEDTTMYLKINGSYSSFSSKNSLLNLLKNKKPELKKFIKDNQIDFHDAKEQSMVKVIAYYDQINN